MRRSLPRTWPGGTLALCCVLLCAALAPVALPAQDGNGVISLPPDSAADILQEALFDRWFAWKRHLTEGDLSGAMTLEEEILQLVSQGGVRGVDVLGGATAREGFNLMEAGRLEEAKLAFNLAVQVRGDLPQVHYGLASLALKDKDPVGWLKHNLAGIRTQYRGLWGSFFLQANLLTVLIGGLGLFTLVFGLVELLKYHSVFRHSVSERLSRRFTMDLGRMLGFAILLLPALLWLGPVLLAVWWILLLYAYMDGKEKFAAWIALLAVAVMPLGLKQISANTLYLDDPVLIAATKLTTGGMDARTIRELEIIVNRNPNDDNLRFLYASALQRAGRPDDAREQLLQLTARSPGFSRALLNLGNIWFREGSHAQAKLPYQQAIDSASCYAHAHYNLALAHQHTLESIPYHEEMEKARGCDMGLVERLSDIDGVIDAELTAEELRSLIRSSDAGTGSPQGGIAAALLNPLSIMAILVLLIIGSRSLGKNKDAPSRACVKCGRSFCNACQPGAAVSAYCTQCIHLYIKKDGVAPSVRVQKSKEVERHASRARWFGRALNFVLPGSGNLFEQRSASGLILLLLWTLLAGVLLLGGRVVSFPRQIADAGSGLAILATLGGMFFVWAVANVFPLMSRR